MKISFKCGFEFVNLFYCSNLGWGAYNIEGSRRLKIRFNF
jgi:hypothetical protein